MSAWVQRQRGMTAKELARKLGVGERHARRVVAEARPDYENRAAERRRIAGTMYAKGASWGEIAAAVGGTEWAARALVRRYKAECAASGRDPNTGDLLT